MSSQLKKEIRVLEPELAAIAKEQAEMDKIRMEAREDYARFEPHCMPLACVRLKAVHSWT